VSIASTNHTSAAPVLLNFRTYTADNLLSAPQERTRSAAWLQKLQSRFAVARAQTRCSATTKVLANTWCSLLFPWYFPFNRRWGGLRVNTVFAVLNLETHCPRIQTRTSPCGMQLRWCMGVWFWRPALTLCPINCVLPLLMAAYRLVTRFLQGSGEFWYRCRPRGAWWYWTASIWSETWTNQFHAIMRCGDL